MRKDQLKTLRHMLGIDDPWMSVPKPYRNYYCATPDDKKMHELARLGAVTMYAVQGGFEWFETTDSGRAAAIESHKTIQKSKAARVYSKFLDIRDCFPDLSFKEFLTQAEFADTRRSA